MPLCKPKRHRRTCSGRRNAASGPTLCGASLNMLAEPYCRKRYLLLNQRECIFRNFILCSVNEGTVSCMLSSSQPLRVQFPKRYLLLSHGGYSFRNVIFFSATEVTVSETLSSAQSRWVQFPKRHLLSH
jgi:hypothetical protein